MPQLEAGSHKQAWACGRQFKGRIPGPLGLCIGHVGLGPSWNLLSRSETEGQLGPQRHLVCKVTFLWACLQWNKAKALSGRFLGPKADLPLGHSVLRGCASQCLEGRREAGAPPCRLPCSTTPRSQGHLWEPRKWWLKMAPGDTRSQVRLG